MFYSATMNLLLAYLSLLLLLEAEEIIIIMIVLTIFCWCVEDEGY